MLENLLSYFFPAAILIMLISASFYFIEKNKIITQYKQDNSEHLKNISGLIISDRGQFKKSIQPCNFDILINPNTIFIFPKIFYIIPLRKIILNFSNSDKKLISSTILLREMNTNNHSVDLISYPKYLLSKGRIIRLQNLSQEQISIFEDIKHNKNY